MIAEACLKEAVMSLLHVFQINKCEVNEMDERIKQLAGNLVNYSCKVKENDKVYVQVFGNDAKDLARAVVKEPSIYVFDDSFSALDFKTDAALRKALLNEITDAIVVIVAQRISTVRDADLIVVLENGEVVGQGNHDQLVAENNETYMEIMNSQFREGEGR